MYRTALRAAPRALNGPPIAVGFMNRRLASTTSAKKGTWKGMLARWGIAGAAIYFYTTSTMFQEELASKTIPPPPSFSDDDSQTVEAVIAEKRKQAELKALARKREEEAKTKAAEAQAGEGPAEGSMEALEEEADSNGAFDPETGEINWDCPCLGGMAHGPCGEEFKAAFSCFVYSKAEPKGIDCIDKFQGMQECFRQHPDVYGAEIDDMDDDDAAPPPTEGEQTPIESARQEPEDLAKPEPETGKATAQPEPRKRQPIEEETKQETKETEKSEPEASRATPLVEKPTQS